MEKFESKSLYQQIKIKNSTFRPKFSNFLFLYTIKCQIHRHIEKSQRIHVYEGCELFWEFFSITKYETDNIQHELSQIREFWNLRVTMAQESLQFCRNIMNVLECNKSRAELAKQIPTDVQNTFNRTRSKSPVSWMPTPNMTKTHLQEQPLQFEVRIMKAREMKISYSLF